MKLQRPVRKRVDTDQLRLGMYISGFEGRWRDHPFWRTHFLLTKEADLQALRSSAVDGVIIDTSQGFDVAEYPVPADVSGGQASPLALDPLDSDLGKPVGQPYRASHTEAKSSPEVPHLSIHRSSSFSSSLADELGRAEQVVQYARTVVAQIFDEARLGKIVELRAVEPVINEILSSIARNRSAITSIVRLKTKDEYTYMHSVAVSALMANLAIQLELSPSEVRDAAIAGLLHDVGKMAVPMVILQKPGALTDDEFELIQTHPARGHALLVQSGGVPEAALDVCLHHHEKIDGTGYPNRLPAERISLFARMAAVCDVYDAVTSDRPYKTPWTPAKALARMHSWNGHFDPVVLTAFIRAIGIYPVGTLVRLESGRLAVVKAQTANAILPVVHVIRSISTREPIVPFDLDLSHPNSKLAFAGRDESIVSAERPGDWAFDDWEHLWPTILADS